jgi:GntR family transcriptional regulator
MHILVTASAGLPLYRQIMQQIVEAIAGGRLKPGDKLDSHRDLAEQLVIAPLTVKKAYDELEALGYIETQRGRGTFVCAKLPRVSVERQREQLRAKLRLLLSEAYLSGFDYNAILKIIKEADAEIFIGRLKEIS